MDIAQALQNVFISPNELDSNLEAANVVDGLYAISRSIRASQTNEGAAAIAQTIKELYEAEINRQRYRIKALENSLRPFALAHDNELREGRTYDIDSEVSLNIEWRHWRQASDTLRL